MRVEGMQSSNGEKRVQQHFFTRIKAGDEENLGRHDAFKPATRPCATATRL